MEQPRQPAGRPDGGQYGALPPRPEADLDFRAAAPAAWPALTFEDVDWRLSPELEGVVPAYQVARLEARPYQSAVPARIADLDPLVALPATSIEAVSAAAVEISAFDREASALPVPMPTVLLRTESASSSQIEHLTANSRNLAVAALGETAGQNAELVADNASAMTRALDSDGPVTRDQILEIHRVLMERSDPDIAGQFRREPVWIGSPNLSPHGADFIAPRWERIDVCVDDLAAFAARTDVNGLVQAAIVHAQFETIHPFADGNGRTGRAIVHTLLRDAGYTQHATVPISSGLLGDVDGYFRALSAYRDGDPAPIVDTFAASTLRAVANGRTLAAQTSSIHEQWKARIKARSDSGAWRLADHLFAQPVVNSTHVARFLGSSPQGAFNAINTLVEAGVLTQSSRDRRNQLWQAKDVLDVMDEFAARAQRRVR
ncbi:Fic family protein [Demequina capsici]|uniref:Fic family protein n=1 Tax=Demequina capsici TaxID=3075620 RepID=A0AA96FDG3_9MICO|nr:Fic family protein [Demequina sp. PMTSA13]WNM27352.1 Fic family protein [Demequina sp. PMTSA13]